mgnify:CR=1 FL=1
MSIQSNIAGIPESDIIPLKEIYEVGKYEDIYRGELVQCKDWTEDQVLKFLNEMPVEHDLFLPVGFIENIEKDPYQLYCDTDSVVGSSIIRTREFYGENTWDENYEEITIEKFWNGLQSIDTSLHNDKEYKDISELDIFTPTVVDKEFKPKDCRIKKIMRHKVSKQLWNLQVGLNDNVVVTEDHSLIIKDINNNLISVTVLDLLDINSNIYNKYVDNIRELTIKDVTTYNIDLKNSCMIHCDNLYFDEIELYEEESILLTKVPTKTKYVYDLEVEDNPVFFANNILVHNSDYLLIKLTFNKNTDNIKTVDYCQKLTIRMNEAYMAALDLYFYKIANWHPDFNTMDFKSEVVAYKGFFATKKFYALGKIWDEGKFMSELSIKKTGGQLKKADATKVTKEMLEDVYNLLTKDQTITDLPTMYNKIFVEIKNKYIFRLKKAINEMDFEYFTIPKKWSFGEKKSIPPQITGAKLYNRIIKDTFTVGDAVLVLSIKFNLPLMKKEFEKMTNPNENMLQNNELTSKINVISLPPVSKLKEEDKTLIKQRFQELDIRLDYDTIMSFNIDMKLEPFKALFDLETTRKALALSGR